MPNYPKRSSIVITGLIVISMVVGDSAVAGDRFVKPGSKDKRLTDDNDPFRLALIVDDPDPVRVGRMSDDPDPIRTSPITGDVDPFSSIRWPAAPPRLADHLNLAWSGNLGSFPDPPSLWFRLWSRAGLSRLTRP